MKYRNLYASIYSERGATMLEYILLSCCCCFMAIASIELTGREESNTFYQVGSAIEGGGSGTTMGRGGCEDPLTGTGSNGSGCVPDV